MDIPGIRSFLCTGDMDTVWERLLAALYRADVPIFASIDHLANAEEAGLVLPPSRVVIFGKGAVGTPLMQAAPEMALELPLRALVQKRPEGVVFSYLSPLFLAQRYGVAQLPGPAATVQKLESFLAALGTEVAAAPA